MLKASEAWAITKKSDKYTEQLSMIEQQIQKEAERGESSTFWYCEDMADYEQKILAKRLEEFGYTTSAGGSVIYISWRNINKE